MNKVQEKMMIHVYDLLVNHILYANGIMKNYYIKRSKDRGLPWYSAIFTAIISFDRHKYTLLVISAISLYGTLISKKTIISNISQAMLSACIFDFVINIISKEHKKSTVVYACYPMVNQIRTRIDNIRFYIDFSSEYGIDDLKLANDNNSILSNKKLPTKMKIINEDIGLLTKLKKDLNRELSVQEYIDFAHSRNRVDINKLLATTDIVFFPNVYKALKCIESDKRTNKIFSGYGYDDICIVYSINVLPYERLLFWSNIEMALYHPDIVAYSNKFKRNSIKLYLQFAQYLISDECNGNKKNNVLEEKIKIIEKFKYFFWAILIFLCIRNSPYEILSDLPNILNWIFLRTNKFADIIFGFTLGVIVTKFFFMIDMFNKELKNFP